MTRERLDLRLAPAAVAAWSMTAMGLGWPVGRAVLGAVLLLAVGVSLLCWGWRGAGHGPWASGHRRGADGRLRIATASDRLGGEGRWRIAAAGALLVAGAGLAVAGLRAGAVQVGPVPILAKQQAQVAVEGVVVTDPVLRQGRFSAYVVVRLSARQVTGRGETTQVRSPLLVIADESWMKVRLGQYLETSGRLSVAEGPDLAGILSARESPTVTSQPSWVFAGIGRVRAGLTEAASPLPPAQRALVPALVDGDDSGMPPEAVEDFKTTGMTHLLAVSGANLTLVLGFVLFIARWSGVRAHGLTAVGVLSVVFFVLLARPEPSVLRAAAMGLVALAGLAVGGRQRGVRALCVAVIALLLLDPWLARSVGFVLSTLATGGILLLAPPWRDALAQWMPVPMAEAIAVPLAAQIMCTPVVAAISGQVSLVAVGANLLAAPAVGPATVLGLVAGLAAIPSDALGHFGGGLAGLPAWWIISVAHHAAGVAGASMGWPATPVGVSVLALLCLGCVVTMSKLLRRRFACLAVVVVALVAILRPIGRVAWPPDGWLMVACDVGQGDGLVLNAGRGSVVVVDTGPEPTMIDRCLDDLEVRSVALVIVTHFHADHVDGLAGVLDGRPVSEIAVSPLPDPQAQAAEVGQVATAAGVPVTIAVTGERRRIGQVSWEVLGPVRTPHLVGAGQDLGAGEEGDSANNASVVMLVEVQGHTFLLTGDAEPEEELDILRTGADLAVDVLKVSHHGSGNQDPDFIAATQAAVALISVGADNDYGHPSIETLAQLEHLGADIYRTDLDGDIAVVARGDGLAVATSKQ